jgi:hypothetical protein
MIGILHHNLLVKGSNLGPAKMICPTCANNLPMDSKGSQFLKINFCGLPNLI